MTTPLGRTHQRVKRLRRLARSRRAREAEQGFVLEGAKLVGEALEAGVALEGVYVGQGVDDPVVRRAQERGVRVFDLAPGVLERVADAARPQPILAVARYVDVPLDAVQAASLVLVAVDLRDPGNAGTVVRSAEAAGASAVIFCEGSVDIYNPKTVRASAGSLFHVPVVTGGGPLEVLQEMAAWNLRRVGTVVRGGVSYDQVDFVAPIALVLGNEAHGLPPSVTDGVDEWVTIPMAGRSESLNVGMAAAVLCFEAARQRRAAA